MEFFLFLLYNQGEILSCKERRNKYEGNQLRILCKLYI